MEKEHKTLDTSDEVHEYEHANETLKQLELTKERYHNLVAAYPRLIDQLVASARKFDAILDAANKRGCPTKVEQPGLPPLAPRKHPKTNLEKMSGPHGGLEIAEASGREIGAPRDAGEPNRFTDSADTLGVGIVSSYKSGATAQVIAQDKPQTEQTTSSPKRDELHATTRRLQANGT